MATRMTLRRMVALVKGLSAGASLWAGLRVEDEKPEETSDAKQIVSFLMGTTPNRMN